MSDLQRDDLQLMNEPAQASMGPRMWEVLCCKWESSEAETKTKFLQMLVLCGLLVNPESEKLRGLDQAALVKILKGRASALPHLKNDPAELHLIAILHCILDLAGDEIGDTSPTEAINHTFTFAKNLQLCAKLMGVHPLDNHSCRIDFADSIKLLKEAAMDSVDAAQILEIFATISAFSQGHDLHQYPYKLLGDLQSLEIVLPFQSLMEIPSELAVHLNPYEAQSLDEFVTETKDLSIFTNTEWGLWAFLIWVPTEAVAFNSEMRSWILRSRALQTIRDAAVQQQQAPQFVSIILAAVSYYQLLGIPQIDNINSSTTICDCQVCAFDGLLSENRAVQDGFLNDVLVALQQAMEENIDSEREQLYFTQIIGCQMSSLLPKPDSRLVQYFWRRLFGWDHSSAKEACCVRAE
ncbi:hypothetical protein CI238_12587 [Colletotrichum incanum]|uniref:Uncharacterized protein n=1 Tax=Colletotrichum incanum TaxID=1573173 RepID=A0A167BF70_COLIC|nr:hypothetical protein CI238_12587 [Colletotrichum incanum]